MWGKKKMTRQELIECRHGIVGKMTAALANNNMKKFDRLNAKYQKISDQIKKVVDIKPQ